MSFKFYIDKKYIGKHFTLSPSSHFLDKDRSIEDLDNRKRAEYAKDIGTQIHDLCAKHIRWKVRTTKSKIFDEIMIQLCEAGIPRVVIDPSQYVDTVVPYINDAITLDMTPEVPLVYSPEAGGTTDAISWNEKKRYLRIHDLKTGKTPAKMDQLLEYAAYFCLCYKKRVKEIAGVELRIYQLGEVIVENPPLDDISVMMDRIVTASDYLVKNYEGWE